MNPAQKREYREKAFIGLGLIVLTVIFYFTHYFFFRDIHYLTSYFLLHLSFLPIHALALGLILEGLMSLHESRNRRKKMSMLLGIFFRQVGVDLLIMMSYLIKDRPAFDKMVMVQPDWGRKEFKTSTNMLQKSKLWIKPDRNALASIMAILKEREEIITTMTRNPHLLEFLNLSRALMSLFHLIEEAHFRPKVEDLPEHELDHLANDLGKALKNLSILWLEYLQHLKTNHPILFTHQTGIHNVIDPGLLGE